MNAMQPTYTCAQMMLTEKETMRQCFSISFFFVHQNRMGGDSSDSSFVFLFPSGS